MLWRREGCTQAARLPPVTGHQTPRQSDKTAVLNAEALEQLRARAKMDPQHVRRLRNTLLKSFAPDAVALAPFPAADQLELHALQAHERHDSTVDGASKLLLRTAAGLLTEAVVLRIATGRSTVCVSSQIGCAAACRFCATGTMGIARSLSAAEILDQVVRAGQLLAAEGRRLRNVVFMGMGEPFHNARAVHESVAALINPALFNYSPSKVLVSTVGVVDGMLGFAEEFPDVGLALSLHSVRQDVRERIIPLAKTNRLPALRDAIVELNRMQSRPVMLEYLMLQGVNDTAEDLQRLIAWTAGLEVHVNLIPFNPIDDVPELQATARSTMAVFGDALKAAGRTTTVRHSLGRDIEAACGQLVKRENLAILRGRR